MQQGRLCRKIPDLRINRVLQSGLTTPTRLERALPDSGASI